MFEISENIVKNYVGSSNYNKGLNYYLQGNIGEINVETKYNDKFDFNMVQISAIVKSSQKNKTYYVSASYNDRSGFITHNCDCPAYGSWNGNGMCKHLAAVLIKFCKEKDKLLKNKLLTNTDRLIEQIKNNISTIDNTFKPLNLQVRYEFHGGYEFVSSLELKIGEEKLYVVRNMQDFIRHFKDKASLEFGKGFTFNPLVHKFEEFDKRLVELLCEIYEIEDRFEDDYYYTRTNKLMSGKKAYFTDIQLKRFFNIFTNKTFIATINGKAYEDVLVLKQDIPLEFSLEKYEEGAKLNFEEEPPVPLTRQGDYYFFRNNIYEPSHNQRSIYIPFYNELVNNKFKGIYFSKEDSEKIASYIIPSLKKISPKIKIDKNLQCDFYEEPLKISIYFDKANDIVTADLKFNYGAITINPLNDNFNRNTDKVLVRDIEGESKVQGILQNFGFKKGESIFILEEEEKLVDFLSNGILALQELSEIYYSDTFKNIKVYSSSSFKSSVRLNDQDLLEFNFKITGVDSSELKNIFKALKEKKKYYKLKKGSFVSLQDKEFADVSTLIQYLDLKDSDLEKEKILISKYNALYLEQSLKDNKMDFIQKNKKFKELVNNIKDVKEMDFSVSEHLEEIMRGYQKVGFKWFKTLSSYGFGGILADEMGLGKTLQTIAFIESDVKDRGENKKPSLVVVPSSLLYNWKSELEKFAPSLNCLVVYGGKNQREEIIKEVEKADVVVTSYPLIRRDIEAYKDIKFAYCFLDEAQQIKNPMSVNAKSVKEIKAEGYFALTGTPIENSLTELWSIFDFIMPGYLLSHSKFLHKYETPISKNRDDNALIQLNKHIQPFILRRLKKDVIKELPPKIEHKVEIELTDEQKKVYMAYLEAAKNEINDEIRENGFNKSKFKILATLTRLRQICCEPSVFIENYEGESGKMLALEEMLEELITSDHRILLFSQFTSVLKLIENRIMKMGIDYKYLDGQTKSEKRLEMVQEFNSGEGKIFLISLKAGGTGLNLTGADVVIHFDPLWNPAVEEQATDRAHRIGQKKTVEVIKLVSRGTIEEKIYALQEKKKEIINNVMDMEGREENLISQMSENEIRDLFEM